jgi:hypothetical protein
MEGASFRFHAPNAKTPRARRLALDFMLHTYPDWVKTWIDLQGGLSQHLITMSFEYASRYMRVCDRDIPGQVVGTGTPSISS